MSNIVNGINVDDLRQFVQKVADDTTQGNVRYHVKTKWQHQTRSIGTVSHYDIGDQRHTRNFEIVADEPAELLGKDSAPNPQELLLAALNACLSVGYAAHAAAMGITIHSLEIDTDSQIDLRGFLGLDDAVNPGFDEVSYVVRLRTDAPHEEVEKLHEVATRTSVNRANFSKAIRMTHKLEIIEA